MASIGTFGWIVEIGGSAAVSDVSLSLDQHGKVGREEDQAYFLIFGSPSELGRH